MAAAVSAGCQLEFNCIVCLTSNSNVNPMPRSCMLTVFPFGLLDGVMQL